MAVLPADLSQFLDSVVAIVVATSDEHLKPEVTRGWGMRVLEDGATVCVSIDRLRSQQTLENLRRHDKIALACIRPDYVARQFKGRCLQITEAEAEDIARIEHHHRLYIDTGAEFEVPEAIVRHHWSSDVVTLRCRIDEVFDQTPGPAAGSVL
jgi:hypothetical protein